MDMTRDEFIAAARQLPGLVEVQTVFTSTIIIVAWEAADAVRALVQGSGNELEIFNRYSADVIGDGEDMMISVSIDIPAEHVASSVAQVIDRLDRKLTLGGHEPTLTPLLADTSAGLAGLEGMPSLVNDDHGPFERPTPSTEFEDMLARQARALANDGEFGTPLPTGTGRAEALAMLLLQDSSTTPWDGPLTRSERLVHLFLSQPSLLRSARLLDTENLATTTPAATSTSVTSEETDRVVRRLPLHKRRDSREQAPERR